MKPIWILTCIVALALTSCSSSGPETSDLHSRIQELENQLASIQEEESSGQDIQTQLQEMEERIRNLEEELRVAEESVSQANELASQALTLADDLGYQLDPVGHARTQDVVLTCEHQITGTGRGEPHWRDEAVIVGPLAFVGLASSDPRKWSGLDRPVDGEYEAVKVPATVEAGATVTVLVPKAETSKLSLLYEFPMPSSATFKVDDGHRAVTFQACPSQDTTWAGGFVVAGRRCAMLDVYVDDLDQPSHIPISFGADDCG